MGRLPLAAALCLGCPPAAPVSPGAAVAGAVDAGGAGAAGAPRVRPPFDLVGYTHSAEGIAAVLAQAAGLLEAAGIPRPDAAAAPPLAVVAPHDDYVYAARTCAAVLPRVRAHDVVLLGVAHHARDFPGCEGRLVFDSFDAWHGPHGDVAISPLRADLLAALPAEDVLVSDEIHAGEHSLEALVPFLQHERPGVAIAPLLVPYVSWERLAELAGRTAEALSAALSARGWSLGADVALVVSADLVHYGDRDWGGRNSADFGTDGTAYDRAVARDRELLAAHLEGDVSLAGLEGLYRALVQDDYHEYRITWCGRFSLPFGLATLAGLAERLGLPAPRGTLIDYATTLDPGRSDPGVAGLGATAPASLHHWVSFAALEYL